MCFLLAFVIQLSGVMLLSDTAVNMDSIEYLELSHSLHTDQSYSVPACLNGYDNYPGESPSRMRQPLYPLFLLVFYWLAGEHLFLIQLLQILLLCVSLWFVFRISIILLEDRFKPWSVLFSVLYFPWLFLSSRILSEALFTFLLWASLYFLTLYIKTDRKLHLFVVGFLMGFLILTKSIGTAVAFFSFFTLAGIYGFKKGLKNWLILLTCSFAVVLPWGVRNYIALGTPTFLPSNSGYNLWVASRPIDAEWWDDSEEFSEATNDWEYYYIDQTGDFNFRRAAMDNFADDNPVQILKQGALRWLTAWSRFPGSGNLAGMNTKYLGLTAIQSGMVILAVIALAGLRSRKAALIILLPVIALSCSLPVTKGLTRYLLPALPIVALLAGHAVLDATDRIIRRHHSPRSDSSSENC